MKLERNMIHPGIIVLGCIMSIFKIPYPLPLTPSGAPLVSPEAVEGEFSEIERV